MSEEATGRPLRVRLIVASALALVSILLTGAEYVAPRARASGTARDKGAADLAVAAAVETLFARYAMDRGSVKSWQPRAAGRPMGRIEQRVVVGPDFLSLKFNHELNGMLAASGAHVVATEKSRDNIVTMHIVRDGSTMRSITFATATDHERGPTSMKGEPIFHRER